MLDMSWIVWLGVISGIASIVSLFFTVIESRKARKAANEAIKAKETIFTKQSTLELKELLDLAGEVQRHLIKRTSPNPGSNLGHNALKEHKMIEDLISKVNEIKSLHPNIEYIGILDREYIYLCKANSKDPKPYQEILSHVRVVITHTNKIVKTNIYS